MIYYKVFDPDGNMHEVPESKLSKLVLDLGWTRTKPTFIEVEPYVENEITLTEDEESSEDTE